MLMLSELGRVLAKHLPYALAHIAPDDIVSTSVVADRRDDIKTFELTDSALKLRDACIDLLDGPEFSCLNWWRIWSSLCHQRTLSAQREVYRPA